MTSRLFLQQHPVSSRCQHSNCPSEASIRIQVRSIAAFPTWSLLRTPVTRQINHISITNANPRDRNGPPTLNTVPPPPPSAHSAPDVLQNHRPSPSPHLNQAVPSDVFSGLLQRRPRSRVSEAAAIGPDQEWVGRPGGREGGCGVQPAQDGPTGGQRQRRGQRKPSRGERRQPGALAAAEVGGAGRQVG
ncbi:hypothetical protein VTI74DRAFT_4229 [Chaetomium olivicolor]